MRQYGGFELPRVLVPATARQLGLSRARIRTEISRGNWQSIARGVVLTRPDEPTRADWADVGLALAGPASALSGWDALRVRGLGAPTPPRAHVLVLTRREVARVVGRVRIRQTDRPYVATRTSIHDPVLPLTPIVSVARAVADTALEQSDLGSVRALISAAVQRGRCDLGSLVAELEAGPRNKSALFRTALADAAEGARSAAEALSATLLRRARVPAFELNVPIVDETGAEIFVVDVLWRALRAALEIDSKEFHFGWDDWQATLTRHNELTRYGLAVTHYPPKVVASRGAVWAAEVASWLRARAVELGVPFRCGGGVIAPSIGGAPPPFIVRRSA